ncbi:hypothetical protein SAMN04487949_0767 [Halogranum gelatinilyticum]|jgi:predicted RNA-binding Zn-ribbon protein involved in translation (DUF1610 family)|uniref:Small CPxCG-related zinc finger protein n=1 Tax=Halogranum gelatinilyticum TaxID=660521 RepID=A0A1G9QAS4_9EURY|nr:HVO_0649 family zinc finger protein [Halogranum gelatinilyticum]SDM08043.1 hypothetical protein SAMN04487949_0767 [Halogranum gelatinilyticum]
MSTKRGSGTTPLDRLKTHYDDVDLTCPKCGYEDADGHWRVQTSGKEVHYQHLCPSCGASRRRTIRL